uniref:E3 ubiquitin-protein ligase MARCH1 n=1 Tax=Anthurium amnicola TaxID=1678845 RepID=A0A1D1YYP4_9ARAE
MATEGDKCHGDAEAGTRQPPEGDESDGSIHFSDAEDQSWHSPYPSHRASSSYDGLRLSNVSASDHEAGGVPEPGRNSCISDCSAEIGLDNGVPDIKINIPKVDKDCRICHLSLVSGAQESGIPIELGCSCKDDLAAAHKQCAEAWFKIRGNRTCEICGSIAKNVLGTGEAEVIDQWNETSSTAPPAPTAENQSFWRGHRFLNFLLACLVFAFVISWLFHFNVPG